MCEIQQVKNFIKAYNFIKNDVYEKTLITSNIGRDMKHLKCMKKYVWMTWKNYYRHFMMSKEKKRKLLKPRWVMLKFEFGN